MRPLPDRFFIATQTCAFRWGGAEGEGGGGGEHDGYGKEGEWTNFASTLTFTFASVHREGALHNTLLVLVLLNVKIFLQVAIVP